MTPAEAATARRATLTDPDAGSRSRVRVCAEAETAALSRPAHQSGCSVSSVASDAAKRALDIVISSIAIVIAAPIMALIAIVLKAESRGPVCFAHIRIGKGGRAFPCWKFRSMRVGAATELLSDPTLRTRYLSNDYKVPIEVDPRVTRVGRFLRRTSLDELPQLFNVLRGSMSLVGPRPIVREELRWYEEHVSEFLSVKPGITGVWQVQGRSRIGYPQRVQVELGGIRRRSFWSDLKILARSVPAVIMARGAL